MSVFVYFWQDDRVKTREASTCTWRWPQQLHINQVLFVSIVSMKRLNMCFFIWLLLLSFISHVCPCYFFSVVLWATTVHSSAAYFLSPERSIYLSFSFFLMICFPLVFTQSQTCTKTKRERKKVLYYPPTPTDPRPYLLIIICTLVIVLLLISFCIYVL